MDHTDKSKVASQIADHHKEINSVNITIYELKAKNAETYKTIQDMAVGDYYQTQRTMRFMATINNEIESNKATVRRLMKLINKLTTTYEGL